jgi:cytochrome c oxidase cbb3-type subunit 3
MHRFALRRYNPLALICAMAAMLIAGCSGGGDSNQIAPTPERRAELSAMSSAYTAMTAEDLRHDAQAMAVAGELYAMQCAGCHGADGHGGKGVADLTRGHFAYGDSADAVRTTIRDGRQSEMPGMGREYGEVELGQIVSYIDTLSTGGELNDYETLGRGFYLESCASCHGPDGRGQTAMGAPDLTDDYWQNGDSMMQIRLAITRGVTATCPPHGEILSPAEIELLTAWVLNLSSG